MDASVRPFACDLAAPLATADGEIERREGLLVRVDDGDAVGLGEATPLPGWTEPPEECRPALETALETLDQEGPAAALAALRGAPAARHGLHLALADLEARRAGDSLAAHLGKRRRDRVPVNATVGDGPADETAAAAREAVAEGFDCVKVKVGARDAAADTGRLAAVREAVGPAPELRADANGAWTRAQAYEAVRNYPTAAVAVVEQPIDPADLDGLAGLRGGGAGIEVAVDETVAQVGVDAVLDAEAADVVVLKPMALGGLDRARKAALTALDGGAEVVVSNTVDAVVARATAGHLAASLPAVRACGLATADRLAVDLAPDPAPVADGAMAVPDGPGTGVETETAWARAAEGGPEDA